MSAARLVRVRPRVVISVNAGRHASADGVDQFAHEFAAAVPVGLAVGGDHPLVDAPGGLDLDVLVDGEQRFKPVALFIGEQV